MSPNSCIFAIDERETLGSNETETSFEPRLTLLVNVGPKNKTVLNTDFRQAETTKIRGKITVSF